jgi:ubiquinone/menaquinone biosynthesis C-methylase UbiE
MKRMKLVPEMEGPMARWYARQRGSGDQIEQYRRQAVELTADLAPGRAILEVAPGPGYLSIEIARLGRFTVTGLDISRTFVEIARDGARQAGMSVDFRHGDVVRMPFQDGSFDLMVCQAAFKNFTEPVKALDEMHRVLRPGGAAAIQDLSSDASSDDIADEVKRMELSAANAFFTRWTLTMLRRRAHSPAEFGRLVARSAFRTGEIRTEGIGLEVRLHRS